MCTRIESYERVELKEISSTLVVLETFSKENINKWVPHTKVHENWGDVVRASKYFVLTIKRF